MSRRSVELGRSPNPADDSGTQKVAGGEEEKATTISNAGLLHPPEDVVPKVAGQISDEVDKANRRRGRGGGECKSRQGPKWRWPRIGDHASKAEPEHD